MNEIKSNNNPDRLPARSLLIKLTTRITTQSLHYRSGNEETAADSVYQLFPQVRKLMEDNPDATRFYPLALNLLNQTLRPYTARWHRWMTTDNASSETENQTPLVFQNERVRRQFRTELKELQAKLKPYLAELHKLAELENSAPTEHDTTKDTASGNKIAGFDNPLKAGLDEQANKLHQQINQKEHNYIQQRRENLGIRSNSDESVNNTIGLALSGGGIRSATFCLGIVQVLAKKNLFHQFDYLSTVSGGGYLGTFISSFLSGQSNPDQQAPTNAREHIDQLFLTKHSQSESPAVRHLRNNSKYLQNRGVLKAIAMMIYGIIVNCLILLPIPLITALIVDAMEASGYWKKYAGPQQIMLGLSDSAAGYVLVISLIALATSGFILPLVQLLTDGHHQGRYARIRHWWEMLTLISAFIVLIAASLYYLPTFYTWYAGLEKYVSLYWSLIIISVLSTLLLFGSRLSALWHSSKQYILALFILTAPLLFLFIFFEISQAIGLFSDHSLIPPLCLGIVTGLLTVWAWLFVDLNTLSPHRYYRNRLAECYLVENQNNEIITRKQLPLTELAQHPNSAPYHLINSTVNLTTSRNQELRGRNGDFFVFSKDFCGSQTTGYFSTQAIVKSNPHLDVATAMAISGAAASTTMGLKTMTPYRFLMGLMNIRLGYWLCKPPLHGPLKFFYKFSIIQLCKEIFGSMRESDRFLNLSDGGHIENLAVYQLLKRQCKFIVCVDGGCDPELECSDLILLQRYAKIDLGIRMEYELNDLDANSKGFSRAHAILIKLIYPDTSQNQDWMIVFKLAVTGAEPAYVADYRAKHPTFPHQTTADQLFDEAQFEAYRMLGECAANSLFRQELLIGEDPETMNTWFQQLANHLLPDNDPVFK